MPAACRLSRRSKKAANVGNVIVEVSVKIRDYLMNDGRIYAEWYSFKVKTFENVFRCFACYGYGHVMKEYRTGRLCRKCCDGDHLVVNCKKIECCDINCKMKDLPSDLSMLSIVCPEYVRVIERMKERISND